MGWLLPKSLNGFLLLGLGFLAGPLLLAILHAAVQMRRLSDTSQQLVVDSVQSTRLTQDMYAQIALLERSARLYQVLGEPTVRASFREHDARLSEIIATLRQRLRAADAPAQLQRLVDTQQRIESLVLPAPAPAGQASDLAQSFVLLGDLANGVANLTDQQIDAESRDLRARTDQAQRELFLESTLLLPLIVIVVLLFALRLSRPLRQIDRAIGELGRGNFSNSIVINGPVDLERLGHQLEWLRNRLLELAQERNRFLRAPVVVGVVSRVHPHWLGQTLMYLVAATAAVTLFRNAEFSSMASIERFAARRGGVPRVGHQAFLPAIHVQHPQARHRVGAALGAQEGDPGAVG